MAVITVDLARLKSQLITSGLQTKDNPLFQVINQLITALQQANVGLNTTASGSSTDISGLKNRTYWTELDETANLPSSVQVLAGSGISLNYATPGKVTVSASGGGSGTDYVVASDGVTPIPSPINDGAGNFVYVAYTAP